MNVSSCTYIFNIDVLNIISHSCYYRYLEANLVCFSKSTEVSLLLRDIKFHVCFCETDVLAE